MYMWVQVPIESRRGHHITLQAVVSQTTWVLGFVLHSCARAVWVLRLWCISPAHTVNWLFFCLFCFEKVQEPHLLNSPWVTDVSHPCAYEKMTTQDFSGGQLPGGASEQAPKLPFIEYLMTGKLDPPGLLCIPFYSSCETAWEGAASQKAICSITECLLAACSQQAD